MAEVKTTLRPFEGTQPTTLPMQKMTQRIHTLTAMATAIDRAPSLDAAAQLLGESLVLLYDLKKVAVLLGEREALSVRAAFGMASHPLTFSERNLTEFLATHSSGKVTVLHQELTSLFPKTDTERAVCAPLTSEGKILGLVVLFDMELPPRDLLLLELLAGRVAAKLLRLKTTLEHQADQVTSQQLITMISELSLVETRETLYQYIVDNSCELLQACRGSLMLIDENGEELHIVAAKGINLEVAGSLPIRMGEGISGRVARSGLFLLVSDIEKDCRIAIANRPRFQTKSFISFPLKNKDRIIGVLNLADKSNGHIFTETDLKHLHVLAGHAAQMIQRTAALENTQKLEELAARDPLTNLYNRRLLEARFHEEINRCSRLQQALTIMMVDLDHFKTYNDLCGHIAGDHALQKIAELLKKSAREMDIVTRYGGEEFCLLLPNTSCEEALFVAERIRRAIENQRFPGETGMPQKKLTASIGIAAFPAAGTSFETLINAADVALYQAKSKGRNRLASFAPASAHRTTQTG
ncbi:MAG: sensor domain-containing diguanylate cyclase [Desulfuromonadaceae bacterium]